MIEKMARDDITVAAVVAGAADDHHGWVPVILEMIEDPPGGFGTGIFHQHHSGDTQRPDRPGVHIADLLTGENQVFIGFFGYPSLHAGYYIAKRRAVN
jgi:hypothetical protein